MCDIFVENLLSTHAHILEKSRVFTIVFVHAILSACDAFCPSTYAVWVVLWGTIFPKSQLESLQKRCLSSAILFFRFELACKVVFFFFWASVRIQRALSSAASARFWGELDVYN